MAEPVHIEKDLRWWSRLPIWRSLSDWRKYRILEMIPGLLVWATFILAISLSFIRPLWVIYFIIIFDLYWLVRVVYILVYIIIAFSRFRKAVKIDWLSRCLDRKYGDRFNEMYHLIIMPTYKESIEVIRHSFNYLAEVNYPKKRMIVVLACEESDQINAKNNAAIIEKEYRGIFNKLIITFHPKDLSGELPGKGANTAWAGRQAKKYIDELAIPYENVLVSSFDVDSCVHQQYFAYLAYTFLTSSAPTRRSYQPIPLFNNNIWQAPALTRVVSNSTTFWLLSETIRPDRLFTFSSHSMSFKALVDVDFWQTDIVTEDSRIFLQNLIYYDGDYEVTPMYIPISMDAVQGHNFWGSMKALYKQQRRWAYGVENFPYMVWNFAANRKISLGRKIKLVWNQLEGVYSWSTAPILLFILGNLPIWVANWDGSPIRNMAIVQNTPATISILMTGAMVGLLLSAVLSTIILPPKPKNHSILKYPLMVLQWVLFPLTMIIFGSIPATEAQTRLLLGKYLGFDVTAKVRNQPDH
ncbi:MAG: glycosyltransferase family 2 protein [Patescibacteria group bacterium]